MSSKEENDNKCMWTNSFDIEYKKFEIFSSIPYTYYARYYFPHINNIMP